MDASAYLKRHGWRGDGHSLDQTGRGIRKPLLVSKKVDVLGVGLNKHAAVSDQWWMRAFDQGLKNLGTGKESVLKSVRTHGIHHGGLYGRFVKGEAVAGTIEESSKETSGEEAATTSKPEQSTTSTSDSDSGSKADASSTDPTSEDSMVEDPPAIHFKPVRASGSKRKRESDEADGGGRAKSQHKRSMTMGETAIATNGLETLRKEEPSRSTEPSTHKREKRRSLAAEKKVSGPTVKKKEKAVKSQAELSPEKLAIYARRAAQKGVPLDQYIQRRGAKYAAKRDAKSKGSHHRLPK